jgi:hypothetical protein
VPTLVAAIGAATLRAAAEVATLLTGATLPRPLLRHGLRTTVATGLRRGARRRLAAAIAVLGFAALTTAARIAVMMATIALMCLRIILCQCGQCGGRRQQQCRGNNQSHPTHLLSLSMRDAPDHVGSAT